MGSKHKPYLTIFCVLIGSVNMAIFKLCCLEVSNKFTFKNPFPASCSLEIFSRFTSQLTQKTFSLRASNDVV